MRSRRTARSGFIAAAMVALLTLGATPALAQESTGIDKAINDALGPFSDWLAKIVFWGPTVTKDTTLPLIVVWLIGAAVFFTVRMKFINFRAFRHSINVVRGEYDDPNDPGETSHFQALTTALSATVGLGNIAGVAVAISLGGPGATFWMIVAAFFGMTTKFVECSLAVKYRNEFEDGSVSGGPMYYLDRLSETKGWPPALAKFLAGFFALATIGGGLGAANMFQANQAYAQFLELDFVPDEGFFANNAWVFGVILAVCVAIVILGGIKSIARVTEKIVPLMAGIYLLAAIIIIMLNITNLPNAIATIFSGAFTGEAAAGGFLGAFIVGIQRSAFSNEAGLGSAAIAHSSARTDLHIREGIVALLEPFIDTIIICTATASIIVVTGVYEDSSGVAGVTLTSDAFAQRITWFPNILAIAVILFAFSTMISWSYYGVKATTYLFGESVAATRAFQVLFCIMIVVGSALALESVVPLMDSLIFLMPITNVLALLVYSTEIREDLREYWDAFTSGEMKTYADEQAEVEAGGSTA